MKVSKEMRTALKAASESFGILEGFDIPEDFSLWVPSFYIHQRSDNLSKNSPAIR